VVGFGDRVAGVSYAPLSSAALVNSPKELTFSVCWLVGLFVCLQDYSKSCELPS